MPPPRPRPASPRFRQLAEPRTEAGLLLGGAGAFLAVAFLAVRAGAGPAAALAATVRAGRHAGVVGCVGRGPRQHTSVRPEGVRDRSS